ncbi:MAG: response regulator [Desulfatitalea sp.]|nr:response regulator [Desulfatitalea sp.]NNJ99284.1 response regulator [Desulfatitalea sp.]
MQGYFSVFNEMSDTDFSVEYMDTKHLNTAAYLRSLVDIYKLKYQAVRFDAILTSDDNAFRFALKQHQNLFHNAPIVFCGVNRFQASMLGGFGNVTGVLEKGDFSETLAVARKMRPEATSIYVVCDNTTTGQINKANFQAVMKAHYPDVHLAYSEDQTLDGLGVTLESLAPDTVAFFIAFWQDAHGEPVSPDQLEILFKNSAVPVFGRSEWMMGKGMAGGKCVSGFHQGAAAAAMVKQVLEGVDPSAIPIKDSPNKFMFDYLELKKHAIALAEVPDHSIVFNKPKAFYEIDKKLTAIAGIAVVFLVLASISLAVNVLQRKRMLRVVRESEAHLKKILYSLQIGVVLIDARNDTIVEVNPVAADLVGLPKEKIIGFPCRDFICPHPEQDCLITQKGQSVSQSEGVLVNAHQKSVSVLRNLICIELGNRRFFLETIMDITNLKQAQREKKQLEAKMAQTQRIEAIGTLAGGIAHDFNNILYAIMGNTELALMFLEKQEGSKVKENLQRVLQASHRAKEVIAQILAFSRRTEQADQPVKIGPVIKEGLKLIRASIPTSITIHQDIAEETGAVKINPSQIHQIVLNLCTNATHAMAPDGGVLALSLREMTLKAQDGINVKDLSPGAYIKLSVKDSGSGIAPEVLEHIFEPYFTTKKNEVGTGLGLSVVLGIVKNHDGDIDVSSKIGQGSEFHVYLPVVDAAALQKHPKEAVLATGNAHVLFVDDEEMIVQLGRQMLEHMGYTVRGCMDPVEALESLRENPEQFDLVITDQTMPNMTGEQLAREILGIRGDIPIILCTGYSQFVDQETSAKMGIHAFVMKPIVMKELAQTIQEVLGRHQKEIEV